MKETRSSAEPADEYVPTPGYILVRGPLTYAQADQLFAANSGLNLKVRQVGDKWYLEAPKP